MSKKDYQALATALFRTRAADSEQQWRTVEQQWRADVDAVSAVLAADSSRFESGRFLEACFTGRTRGMRQVRP